MLPSILIKKQILNAIYFIYRFTVTNMLVLKNGGIRNDDTSSVTYTQIFFFFKLFEIIVSHCFRLKVTQRIETRQGFNARIFNREIIKSDHMDIELSCFSYQSCHVTDINTTVEENRSSQYFYPSDSIKRHTSSTIILWSKREREWRRNEATKTVFSHRNITGTKPCGVLPCSSHNYFQLSRRKYLPFSVWTTARIETSVSSKSTHGS